jgi:hypothetical protein
MIRP